MSLIDLSRKGLARLPPTIRRRVPKGPRHYAPWEAGFDFTPRRPPGPGEKAGPPDFVGIGVQKAGTTRWHKLILAHPGVSPAGIDKELHYFGRFRSEPFGPVDIDCYHGWFPRREGTLTGEWTPDYFSTSGTAPLLKAAAPDTRLLLLLRDPVERFRSGLNHSLVMGISGRPGEHHIQRGFYDRSLDEWLRCFDAEQLLVLQYERCVADPENQLNATYRHLGLPEFRPSGIEEHVGTKADVTIGLDPDVKRRLVEIYEADVVALARRLPDLDLTLWPNFSYLAE
jgi:hypothetical protein